MAKEMLFKEESYRIMGACFEVNFGHHPKLESERFAN